MHFNVMVPVKVLINDEANERFEAMQSYLERLQQENYTQDEDSLSIVDKVMFACDKQYALSIDSVFASAVEMAVKTVMEPYSQNTDNPAYLEFTDNTEDLRHSFETGNADAILYNGKYYRYCELPDFQLDSDGVIREKAKNGKTFLSEKAKKMKAVTVSNKELYKTFKKYAKEFGEYNEEMKTYGYFSNPMCFWDSCSIGGRCQYCFLVKEDCEDVHNGISNSYKIDPLPDAPKGFKWTSAARKKDICVDAMTKWSITTTRTRYDKYAAMWSGTEPLGERIHRKADGLYYYWGGCIFDPTKSIDDVLASNDFRPETAISRCFDAYLDTINTTPGDGEYGYYDSDWSNDWEKDFNEFWDSIEDDDVIVAVHCHM